MKKNKFLSLLLSATMLGAAAVSVSSCSDSDDNNEPALQYNVAGTWFAEYDAAGIVGGGGQMAYSRLITACTFNAGGTGTWYKVMLTDDSGDPIALDGGAEHGDFTYSVGTDGKITCKLTWSQAPSYYPSSLTFTASGDIIKGQEGTVSYDMKKASDYMKAWIAEWDKRLKGGGNSGPNSGGAIVATTADVGKVIGTDGKIYRNVAAASNAGTLATAMIAYVGSQTGDATYNHGLAIALSEEGGKVIFDTAKSICEEKVKYAGAKWCVPDTDQWKQMFKANGGDELRSTGLSAAITAAGGEALPEDYFYWSSTFLMTDCYSLLVLDLDIASFERAHKLMRTYLRACLVF